MTLYATEDPMSTDDKFDNEVTVDMPLPIADSARYMAQYDAAASDDCTLCKWEHRSPGCLAALRAWATTRHLAVFVRHCNASLVAYEVEVPPCNHTITVYVAPVRS